MSSSPEAGAARSPGRRSPSAVIVAVLLGIGAVAVVLAVVPSTLFDLDRFSVPKELALLATALTE